MNTKLLKMKRSDKKGITPVIATIILIAVTLVLALVVGAYTFGLFGSNVKTIQMTSAILYGGLNSTATAQGTSNLALSLNNPAGVVHITAITISGGGLPTTPVVYQCATSISCTPLSSVTVNNGVINFNTKSTAFYFGIPSSTATITSGLQYNYVITFDNGQTLQGVLVAQ